MPKQLDAEGMHSISRDMVKADGEMIYLNKGSFLKKNTYYRFQKTLDLGKIPKIYMDHIGYFKVLTFSLNGSFSKIHLQFSHKIKPHNFWHFNLLSY